MASFTLRAVLAASAVLLAQPAAAWNTEYPACPSPFTPFVYKGCYADPVQKGLVFRSTVPSDDMTIEKCNAICKGNNFKYSGLEYYGICYCGNVLHASAADSEANCNTPCAGNAKQTCGGDDYFSVYSDPTFPDAPFAVTDYADQGCHTDLVNGGRALGWLADIPSQDMTPAKCLDACHADGLPYAGLEYGSECWCGTILADSSLAVDIGECAKPCSGALDLLCGDGNRLSLFKAKWGSSKPCGSETEVKTSTTSSSTTSTTSSTTTAKTTTTTPVTTTGKQEPPKSTTDKPEPPKSTTGKPEPPKSTTDKPEPPKTTTGKPEPPKSTTDKPEPPKSTADKPEPPKSTTTGKPEPPKSTTDRPEPPKSTTDRPEPPKSTTDKPEPPKSTTAKPEPPKSSDKPEPPKSTTDKPEPPKSTTGRPEPPKSTTDRPEPPKTTTDKPEPPKTTTGKPEPPKSSDKPEPPKSSEKPEPPKTTTKPTESTLVTTTRGTATTTAPPVCTTVVPSQNYCCGGWCSQNLPDFDDHQGCKKSRAFCHLQTAACFKYAGWPAAWECHKFKQWCSSVNSYCDSDCSSKKGSCSRHHCLGRNPPKGGPPPVTKTVPCSPGTTTTPTATTTPPVVPSPEGLCIQPTDEEHNYGPGNPVGGIDLPIVTCNNDREDHGKGNHFKCYSERHFDQSPSFERKELYKACSLACVEQYDQCIEGYAEGGNDKPQSRKRSLGDKDQDKDGQRRKDDDDDDKKDRKDKDGKGRKDDDDDDQKGGKKDKDGKDRDGDVKKDGKKDKDGKGRDRDDDDDDDDKKGGKKDKDGKDKDGKDKDGKDKDGKDKDGKDDKEKKARKRRCKIQYGDCISENRRAEAHSFCLKYDQQ